MIGWPPMSELRLFRRHLANCTHKHEGRAFQSCSCPFWCDGRERGKRILKSMGTASLARAQRKLDRMNDPTAPAPAMPVKEAIASYLEDCAIRNLAVSTVRSYRKTLAHFEAFSVQHAYPTLESLTIEAFDRFRVSRRGRDQNKPAKPSTLRKEIECLRAFCAFSVERGWMKANLAKKLRPPKESTPATLPFEPAEVTAILNACEKIGNREHAASKRARERARAFVLVLLYSGLRISDAAALTRSSVNATTGHLLMRQMKTGAALHIKLSGSVLNALDELPRENEKYFFWNGKGKLATQVGNLRKTISRVLKIAGVIGHPHRFRDTFAVSLLERDVPIRTVQLLLGHTSVRTTEKHYAPFVKSQQRLLDAAVDKLDFGESLSELPKRGLKKAVRNAKRNVRTASA